MYKSEQVYSQTHGQGCSAHDQIKSEYLSDIMSALFVSFQSNQVSTLDQTIQYMNSLQQQIQV